MNNFDDRKYVEFLWNREQMKIGSLYQYKTGMEEHRYAKEYRLLSDEEHQNYFHSSGKVIGWIKPDDVVVLLKNEVVSYDPQDGKGEIYQIMIKVMTTSGTCGWIPWFSQTWFCVEEGQC